MNERIFTGVFMLAAVISVSMIYGSGGPGPEAAGSAARNLSPGEAATVIRVRISSGNFVILDVRTEPEYREGRLEGAVLLDYQSGAFREKAARMDRDATYLVYCRTGKRSGAAIAIMEKLGFRNLLHISGGITKWKEEGFPTNRQ